MGGGWLWVKPRSDACRLHWPSNGWDLPQGCPDGEEAGAVQGNTRRKEQTLISHTVHCVATGATRKQLKITMC